MAIDKDRILSVSRNYSDYLGRITPLVFSFAKKQKLDREFDSEIRKHHDLVHDFPQKWVDTARSEYCYGRIFSSTVLLRKFIKQSGSDMMESDIKITRGFVSNPWEYTLFSVDKVSGSLVYGTDALSGDDFLLESENVADLEQKGGRLFWSLLFYNGECYQSYGIINYFKGIAPADFDYFSNALNQDIYNNDGVYGIMQRFPVPFMLLFAFSEIPFVLNGSEKVVYCSSMNIIPGFEADAVEGYLDKSEEDGLIKFAFSDPDDLMRSGTLYVDTDTWEITLLTTLLSRYQELQKQLPFDFPFEPDVSAALVMVSAAEKILGHDFPGTQYDRVFADEESEEQRERLAGLNAAIDEILSELQEGRSPDFEKTAKKHDCSREELETLTRNILKKSAIETSPGEGE